MRPRLPYLDDDPAVSFLQNRTVGLSEVQILSAVALTALDQNCAHLVTHVQLVYGFGGGQNRVRLSLGRPRLCSVIVDFSDNSDTIAALQQSQVRARLFEHWAQCLTVRKRQATL